MNLHDLIPGQLYTVLYEEAGGVAFEEGDCAPGSVVLALDEDADGPAVVRYETNPKNYPIGRVYTGRYLVYAPFNGTLEVI